MNKIRYFKFIVETVKFITFEPFFKICSLILLNLFLLYVMLIQRRLSLLFLILATRKIIKLCSLIYALCFQLICFKLKIVPTNGEFAFTIYTIFLLLSTILLIFYLIFFCLRLLRIYVAYNNVKSFLYLYLNFNILKK